MREGYKRVVSLERGEEEVGASQASPLDDVHISHKRHDGLPSGSRIAELSLAGATDGSDPRAL
jgi:hypothetical protein